MRKVNIAVLGCSSIAERSIIPAIKENPSFMLKMVGSRTEEKGKNFAAKFNCEFGSYNDVIYSNEIEAVYLSLPSGLHYEWGRNILGQGKHLLMEKPFASNLDDAFELIQLAEQKGLIAMEGLAYVFHPYLNKFMQLLNNGVIGEVRYLHSSFGFPYLPENDIRNKPDIGGGAILDNLIYPLSFALDIFGPSYKRITSNIIWNDQLKIDDRGFLKIDWLNVSANLNYGFGFFYQNFIELWGDKGVIRVDRAFTSPKDLPVEIKIENAEGKKTLEIEPANQFDLMLSAFFRKIMRKDDLEINEKSSIKQRMSIISELYLKSRKHDKSVDFGI